MNPPLLLVCEALLVACLVPALPFAAISLGLIAVIFVIALAHALVFGLPLYFFCRRKGWVSRKSAVLGGALVGGLPISLLLVMAPYVGFVSDVERAMQHVWLMAFYSGFGALIGWLFASYLQFRTRPSKAEVSFES